MGRIGPGLALDRERRNVDTRQRRNLERSAIDVDRVPLDAAKCCSTESSGSPAVKSVRTASVVQTSSRWRCSRSSSKPIV